MSTKTKTKTKSKAKSAKVQTKETSRSRTRSSDHATEGEEDVATAVAATPAVAERTAGDVKPPVGTVLEKRFLRGPELGKVRCKCTVEADGIRYKSRLYSSLSAAAMAAAKDLGLTNKTQNGYVFWGLTKPRRPAADRKEAATRAFDRFSVHLAPLVTGDSDEASRAATAAMLREQIQTLEGFHGQVA